MRVSLPVLAAIFGLGGGASAEPVRLDYFELPPYSYVQDDEPQGSAFTVARAIIAGLDVVIQPDHVPLRRVNFEADKSPFLVAAIVRTEERESRFQWIGRLCTDPFVIATRVPSPPIDTLDQARKLKSIAVMAGASNEAFLREHGFTNIDPASSLPLEVRRVAEGHDDGWFAFRNGALHEWKRAGYDPAELRFGAPIVPMTIWMAASLAVPDELVATLRSRFAEKVKDGMVASATGCGA
jgi:polar amino acid transport system substrate-binding protein